MVLKNAPIYFNGSLRIRCRRINSGARAVVVILIVVITSNYSLYRSICLAHASVITAGNYNSSFRIKLGDT